MDNARLLAGLGIQKQLGGSLLQQQQQQQSALLSQSKNQADKLRQGESECIRQPQIFVTMIMHQALLTAWNPTRHLVLLTEDSEIKKMTFL